MLPNLASTNGSAEPGVISEEVVQKAADLGKSASRRRQDGPKKRQKP
jgi:hypothetical protein